MKTYKVTLSPLDVVSREVIQAWALEGNWRYDNDKDWKPQKFTDRIWGSASGDEVIKSINSNDSFTLKDSGHLRFKLIGFLPFYNKYYSLNFKQPKLTKEQFLNCKFSVPDTATSLKVQEKLKSIGFKYPNEDISTTDWALSFGIDNSGLIRIGSLGSTLGYYSSEMRVINYQDVLDYEAETQPDYSNIRVYCPTEEIWNKLQTKFWKLGWLFDTDKSTDYQRTYPYSSGPWLGTELYGTSTKQLQVMSDNYAVNGAGNRRVVDYTELLDAQPLIKQSINILIPQTYDKGQSIIVPAKVASITRGQTISGHFTPGRKRRATIKVGHLSYGRISG